jgi:hypothetical protein
MLEAIWRTEYKELLFVPRNASDLLLSDLKLNWKLTDIHGLDQSPGFFFSKILFVASHVLSETDRVAPLVTGDM